MSFSSDMDTSTVGKLAVIMFTDIAGYTSLMGRDDRKALALVEENQSFQQPLISKYKGTLLKEMGDGNMISFDSAVDAIHCALNIQRKLHQHPELKLRIGIHLGEVIFKGNDVFGDGVNIASRIESIAEPGGICISGAVQQAICTIRGKKEIEYEYLGQQSLKGVNDPIKVFALVADYLAKPGTSVPTRSKSKRNRSIIYTAIGLFLILVFALMMKNGRAFPGSDDAKELKMAIIPFVDVSNNDQTAHLGLGFANSVRSKLSLSKQFDLISSMQATIGYTNSLKSPDQIGSELHVNYLLTGIYQVFKDVIKVWKAKRWHHYRILRLGDKLEAYCDDQLILERTITEHFNGPGKLQFNSWNARLGIDNVRIRSLDEKNQVIGNIDSDNPTVSNIVSSNNDKPSLEKMWVEDKYLDPQLQKAYDRYNAAYNRLTRIKKEGKGETDEARQAYDAYILAKKKYNEKLEKHNNN